MGTDLGLLRLGQSLQNQDDVRITAAIDECYADLKEEGLATWASTAAYPANVVPHVVALAAMNCAESYGVSDSRFTRIQVKAAVAKREIRKMVAPSWESLEEPENF